MATREYFSAPAVIRTGLYAPMFGLDALTTHMRCCGDGIDEIKTAFLLFLSLVVGNPRSVFWVAKSVSWSI